MSAVWRLISHHEKQDLAVKLIQERGRIAIGWGDVGDLSREAIIEPAGIKALIESSYEKKNAALGGQSLWNLLNAQVGDYVIVSDGKRRRLVVRVVGPYEWLPDRDEDLGDYQHVRRVQITELSPSDLWLRSDGLVKGQSAYLTLAKCRNGYEVGDENPFNLCPIVLVENEKTAGGVYDHWQDVTGERYQFPNQYRNRIVPGRRFVYYRGVRRTDGARGTPEYFGQGVIGDVYLDAESETGKKSERKFVAEISDYQPFPNPVPFRAGDRYFENIAKNLWGVTAREISQEVYAEIVAASGLPGILPTQREAARVLELPEIGSVQPTLATQSSLVAKKKGGEKRGGGSRRSPFSTAIGTRGEEIVFEYLRQNLPAEEAKTVRWVAKDGEKPGWDVEYVSAGNVIPVEVKATTGTKVPAVELTENEWRAAKDRGEHFRLAIVTLVKTENPLISIIVNPYAKFLSGELTAEPTGYRLERPEESGAS